MNNSNGCKAQHAAGRCIHRPQPALIEPRRVCCSCGADARIRHGFMQRAEGEPAIVTVTPLVYVSGGADKARIKNAPKVQICETCLVLAVGGTASRPSKQAIDLWHAFRNSLALRYSELRGGSDL